jgi:hypothetical protein
MANDHWRTAAAAKAVVGAYKTTPDKVKYNSKNILALMQTVRFGPDFFPTPRICVIIIRHVNIASNEVRE